MSLGKTAGKRRSNGSAGSGEHSSRAMLTHPRNRLATAAMHPECTTFSEEECGRRNSVSYLHTESKALSLRWQQDLSAYQSRRTNICTVLPDTGPAPLVCRPAFHLLLLPLMGTKEDKASAADRLGRIFTDQSCSRNGSVEARSLALPTTPSSRPHRAPVLCLDPFAFPISALICLSRASPRSGSEAVAYPHIRSPLCEVRPHL